MRRKREPLMTDEEFAEMEDELATKCIYVDMREYEERMRELWRTNPPAAAEHSEEVFNSLIESGALVELPPEPVKPYRGKQKPPRKRYILKAMYDLIKDVYAETEKKERPAEYNPNGIRVLPNTKGDKS